MLRKATIEEPSAKDCTIPKFGPAGTFEGFPSVKLPRSAWKTKKPVVLPGNAPIGFWGDAVEKLMPEFAVRKSLRNPVVNAVSTLVAVTFECPVSVTVRLVGPVPTFGIKMSMNNSPVWEPGDAVNVKLLGGFVGIGVTVPLSTHPAQNPCRGSSIVSA
jgi:hypothetical protein